jgi:riboflavin synthase
MFTGIVQDVGSVLRLEPRGGDLRLTIGVTRLDLSATALGDSMAVAGVCLTVVELLPGRADAAAAFSVDVSGETLRLTTVGSWRVGTRVNLEPALRAGDALGGHLMAGHVDGVAQIQTRQGDARSERLQVHAPAALTRYLARKGSVSLDGVSLTINDVSGENFDINLIPHTLAVTTLGQLAAGDCVNIEVDLIARYVERLAQSDRPFLPT